MNVARAIQAALNEQQARDRSFLRAWDYSSVAAEAGLYRILYDLGANALTPAQARPLIQRWEHLQPKRTHDEPAAVL